MERGDGGGGKQKQQRDVERADAEAEGAGLVGVEAEEHQVAPFQREDEQADRRYDDDLDDIAGGDSENVAKDNSLQINPAGKQRDEQQAEGEKRREYDPDHGVFSNGRFHFDEGHGTRGEQAAGKGPDGERKPEQVGDGDAGDHGVGERVTHERPTLERHETGEQSADAADERTRPQRGDHVVVVERGE